MLSRCLTFGAVIGAFIVLLLFVAPEPSFQMFAARSGLAGFAPATAAGSLALRGGLALSAFVLVMLLALLFGALLGRGSRHAAKDEISRNRSFGADDQPLILDQPEAEPAATLSPLHADPVGSPTIAVVANDPVTIAPAPVASVATSVPAAGPAAEASADNEMLLAAIQRLETAVAALPASVKRSISHTKPDPRLVAALDSIRSQLASSPVDPQLVETLQALAAHPPQSAPSGDTDALAARLEAHERAVADRIDRLATQIADMIAAQRDLITHIAALSAQSTAVVPSAPSPIDESDTPAVRMPATPRLRDPAAAQRLANAIADLRRAASEALPDL